MPKYWITCPECGYYPSVMNLVTTEDGKWYCRECAERAGII